MQVLNGAYYLIGELANELCISRQRVHFLVKKHGIAGVRFNDRITLYSEEDVKKMLHLLHRPGY